MTQATEPDSSLTSQESVSPTPTCYPCSPRHVPTPADLHAKAADVLVRKHLILSIALEHVIELAPVNIVFIPRRHIDKISSNLTAGEDRETYRI